MIRPLPSFIVELFPPSRDSIFRRLCDQMTNDMLVEIAKCDYENNYEENLEALKKIRQTYDIESRLQWVPKEVLSLTRWSEPDELRPYYSHGQRGHMLRAFCCVTLLVAGADPANDDYIDGENETLAQAIESCLYLGAEHCQELGELLTWRYPTFHDYDTFPMFAIFALMVLALNIHTDKISPDQTASMVDQLATEQERLKGTDDDPWILWNRNYRSSFLGMETFDQKHRKWLYFASQIKSDYPKHLAVSELATDMLKDR